MGPGVVGRDVELTAVQELVATTARGPAALVLEGEAGIGKTTVWSAGLEAAQRSGLRLLVCRAAGTEVKLGYAALTDLLGDVSGESIAALPGPQRSALEAALLRGGPPDGASPDPRAVATGFLSLLETLADAGPVLLAVDELQWLDHSSALALAFAARRLRGPVGVLATRRNPPVPAPPDGLQLRDRERLRVLRLGPIAREDMHRLLRERIASPPSAPVLARIDRVAAGNPFVALELARALSSAGEMGPVAVPESLRELVASRVAGLGSEVLGALLLAATLSRPRIATIQRALDGGDAGELLGRAEAAEIVEIERAEVRFTHPLLAGGVYAMADAGQRRAAHRRLATAVEDLEERARHLALANVEADPEVIGALDAAAERAVARGAPAAAAELLELAFGLGAEDSGRLIAAAETHLAAGDVTRADALAQRAVGELGAGPERARALGLLGTIRHRDNSYAEAAALLEQARAESAAGAPRVMLAMLLAFVLTNFGRLPDAVTHAAAAVAEAERLDDRGLLGEALAVHAMVRFLVGEGIDEAALARALEREDADRPTPVMLMPTMIAGCIWGWTGRFEPALAALECARRRCLERGAEVDVVHMTSMFETLVMCEAGDLDHARALVADTSERASVLGTAAARAIALGSEAVVTGWSGDAEQARRCAREALALSESIGSVGEAFVAIEALGRLELSVGGYAAAAETLVPALQAARAIGGNAPVMPPLAPDAIEALLALGRVEEAAELVDWLDERARTLDRPQVTALANRCRGLLLAAGGELEQAEAALADALAAHERQPIRYDHARTLLVAAQVRRRRRRRGAARAALERAHALFTALGASPWVQRCDAELARLGLRHGTDEQELTVSERRIAELAATGLTNREVAAVAFVSPKTVEATLARAYRKLGVHSRAELGRRMA